jgi:hypothetical protein
MDGGELWRGPEPTPGCSARGRKKIKTKAKKIMLKAKRASWKHLVGEITQQYLNIYYIEKNSRPYRENPMRKSTIYIHSNCDIITDHKFELFNTAYMEKSGHKVLWSKLLTKEEQQHLTCNFKHLYSATDTLHNNITLTEIETAINSLKDSTPGKDQIHNCMFRNTPQAFLEIM